jgi:MFS family permease
MQTMAQSWLVLKLSNSGVQLGLVTAAQFLPVLMLAPWGGLIADRFPKRRLLYLTQTLAGLLALALGILVGTGTIRLWMVYVLASLLGLVYALDHPTRQTFIVEMVGSSQLTNAVSLNSTQVNLARVIGPAIGASLIATAGLTALFLANAASYLAVLAGLFMMRANELQPAAVPVGRGRLSQGLRYVQSNPVLRNTLLMLGIVGTLTYEFTVILPLFARFTFHREAGGFAALVMARGFGSAFGGLYSASRRKTTASMLPLAALVFGLAVLAAAAAPTLALAVIAMTVVGFCSIIFLSLGNVILQQESDPRMRGRVMSLWTVAFLGSTPIGGPIIGWIGQYAGPRWGLATGGFAALLAAAWGAWTLRRSDFRTP